MEGQDQRFYLEPFGKSEHIAPLGVPGAWCCLGNPGPASESQGSLLETDNQVGVVGSTLGF